MPKRVKVSKVGNRTVRQNQPHKFRIGNRKGGQSALTMTIVALKDILAGTKNKRDHQNARTVLAMRGVGV